MEIDRENTPAGGCSNMVEDGSVIATPTVTSGSRDGTMANQKSSDTENLCEVSIREDNVLVDQLHVDSPRVSNSQQELAVISGYRKGDSFRITINFQKESYQPVAAASEEGAKLMQTTNQILLSTNQQLYRISFSDTSSASNFAEQLQLQRKEETSNTAATNSSEGDYKNAFDMKTDRASADVYFRYYGQILHQQNMLQDMVRTSTYYTAFMENRRDFNGSIVVDVGAGTGVLSFFALQAGAKHVYAIEASSMAEHMQRLVDANSHLSQRITVINGKVEEVRLPEKADILISEPMGTLLVNERMLETYVNARQRFLKPGGLMMPGLGRLHICPFTDGYLHAEMSSVSDFWRQTSYYGINLEALYHHANSAYFSQPVIDTFPPNILLAPPVTHIFDFNTQSEEEYYRINIPLSFVPQRTELCHGVACWFDVLFRGSEAARWLSTAPGLPPTHWHQLRCLFRHPLEVKANVKVVGHMLLVAHRRQSYDIKVTMHSKHNPSVEARASLDLKEPYYRMLNTQVQALYSPEHDQHQQPCPHNVYYSIPHEEGHASPSQQAQGHAYWLGQKMQHRDQQQRRRENSPSEVLQPSSEGPPNRQHSNSGSPECSQQQVTSAHNAHMSASSGQPFQSKAKVTSGKSHSEGSRGYGFMR